MTLINAKIFTCDEQDTVIENGFISFSNGKITGIGKMENAPNDAQCIDVQNQRAYPGFIDAHCHLGLWEDSLGFEGDDGNEDTDPLTPHIRALDAINPLDKCFTEAVRAGVTSVVVSPGSSNPIAGEIVAIKTAGKRIDDMIIKQPLAIKFAFGENPKSTYHSKSQAPVTRMATAAIIREQLIKTKRYMEDIAKAEADEELDMPEYDAKCAALIPLFEKQLPAHIHAHRADDIFTAIRIMKEFDINYVLVHCTEGHLITDELLAEHAQCLLGPILCDRSKPELTNLTPKSPSIVDKAGIDFCLVTDHPVIPIQYLPLCAALAAREGLSEISALRSVTSSPAKICGLFDRIGSLEIGKDADILVASGSLISVAHTPNMVFCNGELKHNETNFC